MLHHENVLPERHDELPASSYDFTRDPKYLRHIQNKLMVTHLGDPIPFFQTHDGINNNVAIIGEEHFINFASYNYLGLSGHPHVSAAAKNAIDHFGTSVSASRFVSGEISLHQQLENKLANFLGTEACITYVSGHATNVSTIGHMFSQTDLILYDATIHNSILEGCKLSHSKRLSFEHNNFEHLERLLAKHRHQYHRTLIVVEGIYSMEGDIVNLPRVIELKKKYKTYLMVDEAHSCGVLGIQGRGVGEYFKTNPNEVDLWMGTLSKSFASCGGYIAGSKEIVDYLKCTSPGFVYSVGMPPANAAAVIAAIEVIEKEPHRVTSLQQKSNLFLECAQAQGLNTGLSSNTPIIPVIVGDSLLAMRLSQALFELKIQAPPIIFPAVGNEAARLRFFVTCDHTNEQIVYTVKKTAEILSRLKGKK